MNQRPTTYGSRQAPDPYDQYLEAHNLYRKHTARDATCLFRCISEQMYDSQMLHFQIRLECVDYMSHNRGIFEQYVKRNFDEYLMDLAKINTLGTLLELRALSYMYKRNVLLYLPYDLGNVFVSQMTFSGFFRVFYTSDNHFDSVYNGAYVQEAALCQSIVYDILYRGLFKIPDVDYAVEKMLHPSTFEYGTFHTEYNDEGFLMHILTMDNRLFCMDTAADSNCILENFRQCNFHCEIHMKLLAEKENDVGKLQYDDNENTEMLLPSRLMSCVRQLLEDGITPFPYKVAKSLDPNIYRNIEFDSWNEMRKEQRRSSQYQCVNGYKVGDKCYVKLENHEQQQYVCYLQEITRDGRYCVVFVAKLGTRYKVSFDALLPLSPSEARACKPANHFRHVSKNLTYMKYNSKSRNSGGGGGCITSYWKKNKYFEYQNGKDFDFDLSAGPYKLKQYIEIDDFCPPQIEYYAYPLTTTAVSLQDDSAIIANSDSNGDRQQSLSNINNERNMIQNNLLAQSNIQGNMNNLRINAELDCIVCGDSPAAAAVVVDDTLSEENVNRDLNHQTSSAPPAAAQSRVVLCSGGSYQNVCPCYEYTPQPIMQPHMPMFVREEYIGIQPTPPQPLLMQNEYGQYYYIFPVAPPPYSSPYPGYPETPNPPTPSVSIASTASTNQVREEISVAEQRTNNPSDVGNVENHESSSPSTHNEKNNNMTPIVGPPPHPFQPPVVTPPHQHLPAPHPPLQQQQHESPFQNVFRATQNVLHHGHGNCAGEHSSGPHITIPDVGKINLGAQLSTRLNGNDLPTDMPTLRYFYNLGVECYRKTQMGNSRERRRSSAQIDNAPTTGLRFNNNNNSHSSRGNMHRQDYNSNFNNQFVNNNNNNNYQRNNSGQQQNTQRTPSNFHLNNIESMPAASPNRWSRDETGSQRGRITNDVPTTRGAEQYRRMPMSLTTVTSTFAPIPNAPGLPIECLILPNNNYNIAGNVEQHGYGSHDYNNMANPNSTETYDGFNGVGGGAYVEVLSNEQKQQHTSAATAAYEMYTTRENETATTAAAANVVEAAAPQELNALQKTNETNDISSQTQSTTSVVGDSDGGGGGITSDIVKQQHYAGKQHNNAAAKHNNNSNDNNMTPNDRQNVAATTMNGNNSDANNNNIDVIVSASNDAGSIATTAAAATTTTLVETETKIVVVGTKSFYSKVAAAANCSTPSSYKNNNNLRLKSTKFGNDAAAPQVIMNGGGVSSSPTIYYNNNNNNNSTDYLTNCTTPQILPMLHDNNNVGGGVGGGSIIYDNNNMLSSSAVGMSPTPPQLYPYITYPCPTTGGPPPPPPPSSPQQQQQQLLQNTTPVFYASKNGPPPPSPTTSTVAQAAAPQPLIITQQNDLWYSLPAAARPSGFPPLFMPRQQQQNLINNNIERVNNGGGPLAAPPAAAAQPRNERNSRRGDNNFR